MGERTAAEVEFPRLAGDELREALRWLAQTPIEDSERLEQALHPFLVPPAHLDLVFELLMGGGLALGTHLSLEEIGALRALGFGALLGSDPAAEVPMPIDGHGLLLRILEGLPLVLEPAREALVDLLAGMTSGRGEPLIGSSFVADLERLREAYPELAPLYERLLAALLRGSGPEEQGLQMRYAIDTQNPSLVTAALSRWLAEDPETALVWAAESFDDPSASLDLQRAISSAVAQVAPVEEATHFLAPRAKREMLGEFLAVGGREGGMDALRDEYWNLRILGNADERSRRMLISGLLDGDAGELLAIAGEDPSATVRSQAWITLTAARDFVPTRALLDRLFEARDRPELGLDVGELVTVAGNFARGATRPGADPSLVAGARELLLGLYRDSGQPDWARRRALEKLRPLVSDDEYRRLSEER